MTEEIAALVATLDNCFDRAVYLRCQELIGYDSQAHPFWHLNVYIGLILETLKMQFHLKRAYSEQELNYLAWSARNLLELRVWSLYIVRSEKDAWRFHQDQFIDGTTAIRSMEKAADKAGRSVDAEFLRSCAADLRTKLEPLCINAGVNGTSGYLSPRSIAKEVGLDGEFEVHNTITSKLLHATGFSVLVAQDDVSKAQTMDSCFVYAASNALTILDLLNSQLKVLGLPAFQ